MITRKYIIKTSAKRQVLEYLKKYGSITRDIAEENFKTKNLSKIVWELNQEGEDIKVRQRVCNSVSDKGYATKINEYYLDFIRNANETKEFILYRELHCKDLKVWPKSAKELIKGREIPESIIDENGKTWKVKYAYTSGNSFVAVANRFFRTRIFVLLEYFIISFKNGKITEIRR